MKSNSKVDSPFLDVQPVRLGFGILMLLLLMVVGAGGGLLVYLAMQVPAITSEFNAWLGRTTPNVSLEKARKAQLIFASFLYSAPLLLGLFVYGLHFVLNWLTHWLQSPASADDEEAFRME